MKRLIILLMTFACLPLFSQNESVDDLLNHANTYYWLSRARGNDLLDIEKQLKYSKRALIELKESDSIEVAKKIGICEKNIIDAEAQKAVAENRLSNYSPLFSLILQKDDILTKRGNPEGKAISRAVDAALSNRMLFSTQHFLIIISDEKNTVHEEMAHSYIADKTDYYALSRHELATVLNSKEMEFLYSDSIPEDILLKISNAFSPSGIGILKTFINDKVDNVVYAGASYQFWDAAKRRPTKSFVADGFCEKPFPFLYCYLLLLLGIPGTIVYNMLNKRKSAGSFPPWWAATGIAVLSFIILMCSMKGFSYIPIGSNTSAISPIGIIWIIGATIFVSIVPLFLVYLFSPKIAKIAPIMNNPETIASIVSAVF